MKESEFIELLNLYLDHEIDPADAARLEAEVQRDARRRHIYRQYCQMQKACSQLASKFADTSVTERSVEVFTPTRISRPTWYAGGLAAAACVTVFLMVRSHQDKVAVTAQDQVAVVAPVAPARVQLTKAVDFRTAPINFNLNQGSAVANDVSAQLNWIKAVQFSPVNMNANAPRFDAKSADSSGNAVLVAPQISQEPLEHVAFTLRR